MKWLIILAATLVVSSAESEPVKDEYNFNYSVGDYARTEMKTSDGITKGSYSYVDPNGQIQKVIYTADDKHGFQVEASNLPVAPVAPEYVPVIVTDTPEVSAARAEHIAAVDAASKEHHVVDHHDYDKHDEEHVSAIITDKPEVATVNNVYPVEGKYDPYWWRADSVEGKQFVPWVPWFRADSVEGKHFLPWFRAESAEGKHLFPWLRADSVEGKYFPYWYPLRSDSVEGKVPYWWYRSNEAPVVIEGKQYPFWWRSEPVEGKYFPYGYLPLRTDSVEEKKYL